MPELPEVETVARSLAPVIGCRIVEFQLYRDDILQARDFEPDAVRGERISRVSRRGKYLILTLTPPKHIVVHLGMTGRFWLTTEQDLPDKHTHARIRLTHGVQIHFRDPRRFGGIWLVHDPATAYGRMGPEPLSRDFSEQYLAGVLNHSQAVIKHILLDQKRIAGIGNIYADESLFAAGIRPGRKANSLSAAEIRRLHRAIRKTLTEAISARGTTLRDYRDGLNLPGEFQERLKVYGKKDAACSVCGQPIVLDREVLKNRSSHYCPGCQR